ncbi:S8 family serine peptidase [Rhodocaloribacter sp.]
MPQLLHTLLRRRMLLLGLLLLLAGLTDIRAQDASWRQKVDPTLLQTAGKTDGAEFIVRLAEQADLSEAAYLRTKDEKAWFVYERLTEVARRTQPAVTAELEAAGVAYRPFWITNAIAVKGTMQTVEAMARRSDVAYVYHDDRLSAPSPLPAPYAENAKTNAIEDNVIQIGAPDVWALGITGEGAVVGGQDTGYMWEHAALINKYRGWDGATADHNYNWHDAIHSLIGGGSNPCGLDSPVPCDDNGHGTHTMGTMIGDDGGSNQIGVAPGAKWMACRNMERGNGTLSTYIECFEWFTAPTDLGGGNPDPTMSPHVINNSWSCPTSEGCNTSNFIDMETALNALRAAGTVVVVSAGNSGPSCNTVNTPAAIFEGSLTVGSVNGSDVISSFSSRGSVTVDGSGRLKPNVSAPGESVRSSYLGGGYLSLSGTSMAGPHVAATVALMISANPALAGDVNAIEDIIESTAIPRTTTTACGGIPGDQIPNNTYGYGRVDALAAVLAALGGGGSDVTVTLTPLNPPIVIGAGGGSFQYDLNIVNGGAASVTLDIWITIDGNGISRTLGPVTKTIAAGGSLSRTFTQTVPAGAPAGTYTQTASIGSFPIADASDSFTWEKSAAKGDGPGAGEWASDFDRMMAEASGETPDAFTLDQNYPNPFNPTTLISYTLPEAGHVTLKVYDLLGREVRTLVDGFQAEGLRTVAWDATGNAGERLPSGTYLYRLDAGRFTATRQMTLIK